MRGGSKQRARPTGRIEKQPGLLSEEPCGHCSTDRHGGKKLTKRPPVAPAEESFVRSTDDVAAVSPDWVPRSDAEMVQHLGKRQPHCRWIPRIGSAAEDPLDEFGDG